MSNRIGLSSGLSLILVLMPIAASADIHQWMTDVHGNIIDSGKSCPDGAGVSAVPGADLSIRDLTQAYMPDADLTYANLSSAILYYANLTNATLNNANLNGTRFLETNFSGANLTGCSITNFTSFSECNITSNQLYSTASYNERDLFGIDLSGNNLSGWNFNVQNLTYANFSWTNVTSATFYNTNLNNAELWGANLTNAILTKVDLKNAYLPYANLTNASLINANLTFAEFFGTSLTGANLNGTDLRNARHFDSTGASMKNAILPDGTIQGLHLDQADPLLIVRIGLFPVTIPIHIFKEMKIESGSVMDFILTDESWDSTISFDKDIPVTLAGDLHLEIDTTDPASLIGASFQLFDWTGVNPTGQFQILSDDVWDTSHLYTDGTVTLLEVPEPSTLMLLGCATTFWALITLVWPYFG
jgi:uncharacterized protein YjbI with pentapeptide repeats